MYIYHYSLSVINHWIYLSKCNSYFYAEIPIRMENLVVFGLEKMSTWIRRQMLVFQLQASRCYDIRVVLNETNLLPAAGHKWMCWEPQPRPDSQWSLSNWAVLAFLSCLFLSLVSSQGLFHLELLEIPLSVERHPSVALSGHFRQNMWLSSRWIQAPQSFRRYKMTEWSWKGKCVDSENVDSLTSEDVSIY